MTTEHDAAGPLISRRDAAKLLAVTAGGLALGGCGQTREVMTRSPAGTDYAALRQRISGTVIADDEPQFESTRQAMIWHATKPDRRPEVIVRVASAEDVQEAVRFANRHGMKVAIRGGGHNWFGASMRNGGLLLDLSGLRELQIDAATQRIWAQPAVTNGELVAQLTPHNLAFPVGHCPSVPLSGYLLAGGVGWNSGAWGPACTNVRAIDIVTADGQLVRADDQQNADLFWAARGGGAGFFGVTTRYELQAHPLPRAIRTAKLIFPTSAAVEVGRWLAGIVPTLSPEVELNAVILAAPPGLPPGAPQAGERMLLVIGTAFADTDDQARQMLAGLLAPPAELNALAPPLEETPLDKLLANIAALFPATSRYSVDTCWCDMNAEEALRRLTPAVEAAPSPGAMALVGLHARPLNHSAHADVAMSVFAPTFAVLYGIWNDETDDAVNRDWVKKTAADIDDVTVGYYVGEADLTAAPDRAQRCYSASAWQRLRSLRAKYDPAGVFHDYPGPSA